MKVICLISSALMLISVVECVDSVEQSADCSRSGFPSHQQRTLKVDLDYMYKFYKLDHFSKHLYKKALQPLVDTNSLDTEPGRIVKAMSAFVKQSADLRKFLLKNRYRNVVSVEVCQADNDITFDDFVVIASSIHDKLTVLSSNIVEWNAANSSSEAAQPITKVSEGEALEWFKREGFARSMLSEKALLSEVRGMIDFILIKEMALDRLIRFHESLYPEPIAA